MIYLLLCIKAAPGGKPLEPISGKGIPVLSDEFLFRRKSETA